MKLKSRDQIVCLIFSFFFILFSIESVAQIQQKKWYTNGKTIDFQPGIPSVSNMPSGPNYNDGGSSATNGFYGPTGNLLIFANGNGIYNKFGNLITYIGNPVLNPNSGFLAQTFNMGKSVVIIPNPEFCERYFVIYDVSYILQKPTSLFFGKYKVLYTEVDLSANNEQGAVHTVGSVLQKDIILSMYEGVSGTEEYSDTYASFVVSQLINGKRLLYLANQVHSSFLFPEKISSRLYKFEITGQGISNSVELYQTNQFGLSSLEMEISHDNQFLAIGCVKHWGFDFINRDIDVVLFHLNNNGDLNPIIGNSSAGVSTINLPSQYNWQGVGGIEFTPNNQRLFAAVEGGDIQYINLSDLSYQFIPFTNNFTNSQLELAYNGYIYLASANNKLIYIDWNLTLPVVVTNGSPYIINFNSNANPFYTFSGNSQGTFYLLPKQIDGQNYDQFFNNYTPLCCAISSSYDRYTFKAPSSAIWTAQNNPLNNSSSNIAYIENKLIIPSNTTITIQNMILNFAPGASIEIHNGSGLNNKGGKLILDNSTLTIDSRCSSLDLWKGIEVWGTSNQNQFPTQWSNHRGTLEIKNQTVIEFADNAVTLWKPNDYSQIGGIVKCENSFFKNNRRSVEFIAYQNFSPGGNPLKNLSYFTNTEFFVDNQYLINPQNPNPFSTHITIWKCDGIEFRGCQFLNLQSNKVFTQVKNIGIESLDAGYNVYGICSFPVSTGQTCPENQLQRSLFSGLDIGILARGTGLINTINVQETDFSENVYGLIVKQVDHYVLKNNLFNFGCSDIQFTPFIHEGLVSNSCTGYKIENNIFSKSDQCGFPATTFGLRLINSGTAANRTFKNQFNGLSKAQLAEGLNRNYDMRNRNGLRFICNENNEIVENDLYIKRIASQIDVNEHGVSVFQGGMNTSESAGNKFTNAGFAESDIYNLTNFTISYSYSNGIPNHEPLFNSSNVNVFPSIIQNSCIERPVNIKMSNNDYTDLNLEIDSLSEEFSNQNYLYNQLIDAGNTQSLIDQVNYNWSSDDWELRTQLLQKSPFLSQDVLKEIISNSHLPNVLLLEVLLTNPDATKDENFINFLLDFSTLSSNYVDLIRSSWSSNTTRTTLESLLSFTKEQLAERSNFLYNRLQTDSLKRTDDLRIKLNETGTIEDQFKLSMTYFDRGQYNLGKVVLDGINEQELQSEYDLLKLTELKVLTNNFHELFVNGNYESNLKSEQIESLVNLKNSFNHYYSKGILNNLLCFHYRICDELVEYIPDLEILAKKNKADVKNKSTKDLLVDVYPNPASNYCVFDFKDKTIVGKEIKVFNITGIEMFTRPVFVKNSSIVLNTDELKNGIYYYEILTIDNKTTKGKFIINKN